MQFFWLIEKIVWFGRILASMCKDSEQASYWCLCAEFSLFVWEEIYVSLCCILKCSNCFKLSHNSHELALFSFEFDFGVTYSVFILRKLLYAQGRGCIIRCSGNLEPFIDLLWLVYQKVKTHKCVVWYKKLWLPHKHGIAKTYAYNFFSFLLKLVISGIIVN